MGKYYINDGKHKLVINAYNVLEACQKFIDKYQKKGPVILLISEKGFREDPDDLETKVYTQHIT